MAISLKQIRANALERVKGIRAVQPAKPYHPPPSNASVFVNFPHQVADRVAKMGLVHIMDPRAKDYLRWKNNYYKENRVQAENELFGLNTKDKQRPIYGSVHNGHFPADADMYGHLFIKFHPSINQYSTFSPDDSLNVHNEGYEEPHGFLRTKTHIGDVLEYRDEVGSMYAEAQIHHPLNLRALREHAHYVGVDSAVRPGTPVHRQYVRAAIKVGKALGVPVYDNSHIRTAPHGDRLGEAPILDPDPIDESKLPEPIWKPPVARIRAKAKR